MSYSTKSTCRGEQITQLHKQRELDLFLTRQQSIERTVPLLELTHLNADPRHSTGLALSVFAPSSDESLAAAVTDKVALQPLPQRMLTARCCQPVGHQDQSAIAEGAGITAITR